MKNASGSLAILGSGETSPNLISVHRELLTELDDSSGIFMIDRINFIPIYLKNFYDIYPLNRQSTFRLFAENKIGFSLGKDFGSEDYISTNGGFFWSPSIGIKKSSGKKHISLKRKPLVLLLDLSQQRQYY